ncbi:hypothetical protein UPYG_G00267600 [Umbra pygmaea]|uniref:Thromboxane-A synthase n=1 Tax=Umbra pygmaea TaxID=75934 RepID=A0ABD0WFB4_UMBPY
MSDCLLMLRNERWKRVRSIITPSFSAAKMKEMCPLITTATNTLLTHLHGRAESGMSFDIHRCFGSFTMDVIASVAFGTQVDSQNDPDDPFVCHAQKFFSFSFFTPFMAVLIAFPFLTPLARILPNKRRDDINKFFINCIKKIIRQRDQQPVEEESPTKRPVQTQRTMTDDEIVGQAFVFFLAGYETSSNTLAFTCYLLAEHPECQRCLQDEVDQMFTRYDSPDYSNVQELKYLDMVISEALRLYPPGFRFARDVDEDCMVNGQFLPKGATLVIPAGFLHCDPEYWPEPQKFIPERFTAEAKANRHPFVYLPFGAGPRSCVGMRLAQLEIKMALVHVFRNFNIVSCTETKVPLELKSHTTLGPKNGIYVKFTKRSFVEGQSSSAAEK